MSNDGSIPGTSQNNIKLAFLRMKKGNTTRMDGNPSGGVESLEEIDMMLVGFKTRKAKKECIVQKCNDLNEGMTANNSRLTFNVLKALTSRVLRTCKE